MSSHQPGYALVACVSHAIRLIGTVYPISVTVYLVKVTVTAHYPNGGDVCRRYLSYHASFFANGTDRKFAGMTGNGRENHMAGEVSIVAIVKGEERYVFMFDDDSRSETLRKFGQYASDPDLSFTWYDAAVLSQKVRKTRKASEVAGFELDSFDRNSAPLANDSFPDFDFPSPDDMWIGDDPV